jgi:ABC-type oligopeptide transport system substrate-binding subunit
VAHITKRRVGMLLALTLALALLGGTLAQTMGGTLRVAINSDPSNLDPHRSTAFITRVVLGSVVEGLFTSTPTTSRSPIWPSASRPPTTASPTRSACATTSCSTTAAP